MADRYWDGSTDGDWNTAANWTPAAVTSAGENVLITDTAVSIDAYDNSAVALGIVTIGPGFTGNIGTSAGDLILSCAASKRIVIDGAPSSTTQEMWIDYNSANATTIEVKGYGTITAAGMATKGIHLTRTAGTLTVVNHGGPVSFDSGTAASYIDAGSAAQTIAAAGTTLTQYKMIASAAVATLNTSPVAINVSAGTVTVNGTATLVNVVQWGGSISWNGGAAVSGAVTIYGGTFDTSSAVASAALASATIYGDSSTTLVDLTLATVSGTITTHGTPTIIYPPTSTVSLA